VENREEILLRFKENITVTEATRMKLEPAPQIFVKTSYTEFDEIEESNH
jgi:hypothetical protein